MICITGPEVTDAVYRAAKQEAGGHSSLATCFYLISFFFAPSFLLSQARFLLIFLTVILFTHICSLETRQAHGADKKNSRLTHKRPPPDLILPNMSSSSAPPNMTAFPRENHYELEDQALDVIPTRAGRKLCVRHKQMANQNVNEKLQRVSAHLNCCCTFTYRALVT